MTNIQLITTCLQTYLLILGILLPIVNPPGIPPIFWNMTQGASNETRKMLANRIFKYTVIMLLITILTGNIILKFFGISIPVIQVGGGILIMFSAWNLLNAKDADTESVEDLVDSFNNERIKQSAFYPMTFPVICGPGSISAAITIGATFQYNDISNSIASLIGMTLAVITTGVVIYIFLRFTVQILQYFGSTGTQIIMRLSAFILLCIGVQILWNGISTLVLQLAVQIT